MSISLSRDAIKERVGVSAPFNHVMAKSGETSGADSAGDVFSVQYHGYTQTHLDALMSIFHGEHMFNGVFEGYSYSSRCRSNVGSEYETRYFYAWDSHGHSARSDKTYLKAADAIYPEHLDLWLKKTGAHVENGDALIVRTGRWHGKRRRAMDIESGSAGLHAAVCPG